LKLQFKLEFKKAPGLRKNQANTPGEQAAATIHIPALPRSLDPRFLKPKFF
jgi:hypothetical protein